MKIVPTCINVDLNYLSVTLSVISIPTNNDGGMLIRVGGKTAKCDAAFEVYLIQMYPTNNQLHPAPRIVHHIIITP
jgi:hypothetical protein